MRDGLGHREIEVCQWHTEMKIDYKKDGQRDQQVDYKKDRQRVRSTITKLDIIRWTIRNVDYKKGRLKNRLY